MPRVPKTPAPRADGSTYVPDPANPIPFDVRCDDCGARPLKPCAKEPPHSGAYHLDRVVRASKKARGR